MSKGWNNGISQLSSTLTSNSQVLDMVNQFQRFGTSLSHDSHYDTKSSSNNQSKNSIMETQMMDVKQEDAKSRKVSQMHIINDRWNHQCATEVQQRRQLKSYQYRLEVEEERLQLLKEYKSRLADHLSPGKSGDLENICTRYTRLISRNKLWSTLEVDHESRTLTINFSRGVELLRPNKNNHGYSGMVDEFSDYIKYLLNATNDLQCISNYNTQMVNPTYTLPLYVVEAIIDVFSDIHPDLILGNTCQFIRSNRLDILKSMLNHHLFLSNPVIRQEEIIKYKNRCGY